MHSSQDEISYFERRLRYPSFFAEVCRCRQKIMLVSITHSKVTESKNVVQSNYKEHDSIRLDRIDLFRGKIQIPRFVLTDNNCACRTTRGYLVRAQNHIRMRARAPVRMRNKSIKYSPSRRRVDGRRYCFSFALRANSRYGIIKVTADDGDRRSQTMFVRLPASTTARCTCTRLVFSVASKQRRGNLETLQGTRNTKPSQRRQARDWRVGLGWRYAEMPVGSSRKNTNTGYCIRISCMV